MEGLVKPFCKVGVVVGDQGLGAGCGVGSSPSCSPLGVGLRVRKIPMRLASPGVLVELEVRGGGCLYPHGRFAHMCGAGSAEHRVGAGGCVGAEGGKAVYSASGCLYACLRGLCKLP